MEGERAIDGVTFGSIYCEDLGLVLSHRELGNPKPKTSLVEIPGSSVILDFSEAFGAVQYSGRKISLEFMCIDPWSDHYELETAARDALHGQKMHIRFDEDDSFYYVGRISIDSWVYRKRGGKVKMSIECEPWKYKDRSVNLNGDGVGVSVVDSITNAGLRDAAPTVHAENNMTVVVGNETVSLTAGQNYTNPALVFEVGANSFEYSGASGRLGTVTWTEVHL